MNRQLLLGTGAVILVASQPAAAQAKQFEIPAQAAETAIAALARQAGIQIIAARSFSRGKRTNAVRGVMTADAALSRLLEGTGLRAQRNGPQTYVVLGASPYKPAALTQVTDATDSGTAQAGTDGGEETGGDIVVTGIRQSLRTSINQKRNADRVQEVLAAEDIGKLPEASIAESLARLPGLATNRDRGNGTQISIRGLGPNLVNTLLNGREIVSAEASRNVRYEQYPAELINGASVFKSPTAAQVEGAIAGQVDLRTLKPLDYKDTRVVLNARAIYSDLAEDVQDTNPWGYIASASLVTQLFDDTLGLAVGYSGRRQSVATVRTNIFRYTNSFADLTGNGQSNDNIPFGFEGLARGGDDIRHGALAALQWRPSDRFELNGDVFYSHVKFEETQRGFRVENLPFGNTLSGGSGVTLDTSGSSQDYVTGITTTNANTSFGQVVRGVNESFFFKDDLYAGGLNATWRPGGWTITGDLGYSTTHRDQQFLTLRTEPFGVIPTTSFTSRRNSVPQMRVSADLSDPSVFRVADFQIPSNGGGAPRINDSLWTGSVDADRKIARGPLAGLRFGARYTDRSKDYTQRTQFGFIDPAARAATPSALLNRPYAFSGAFAGLPTVQSIDINAAVERLFGPIAPTTSDDDRRSSWKVAEKTYAGYQQLDLDGSLFGLPFTGNLGLRVIRTETLSKSVDLRQTQQPDGSVVSTVTPIAVANAFTDWLPNLNLTFRPSDKLQLRFGASEAISRPPLDDLSAGVGLFTFGAPAAFGGNPLLEPFRAKQLDATVEWYFDRDSALTISGFYKDLSTFIVQQVTPITVANPAGGPDLEGTFRQPVNGSGGTIKGVEVLFQKALTFLPAPFDGLGVYLNYSYTDSNISVREDDNAIGAIQLPGLSKHVGNATLYYSKAGFEARIAFRYRSSYATELGDTDRILFTAPESVMDFQTSYEFAKGSRLDGVRLLLQANNLTDEPFETYYGDRRLQGRHERFGRRFLFGIGYQF
ncbi:TonB-dependent receptor [Sphingomonas sp. Leaf16]|nr:TonB-dependent receptor [Sphingomonas sp. Leaf16]KQN08739.1 TonB-dependent receptor [Sphingomonas sp. Leaf29]KQN17320.1 TonB-dependent receptor [Sphingomonas sp. Leaf32]